MSNLLEPSSRPKIGEPFSKEGRWGRMLAGVGAGLGLLGLAFCLDAWGVEWVRAEANGWGKWFAGRVGYWGDWFGIVALGLLGWLVGRLRKNAGMQRLVLLMGVCAALSGVSANVIRACTGRARPFSQSAPGWYGVTHGARLSKSAHEFQSFPSAHTAVVAGFLAPLAWACLGDRRRGRAWLGVGVALGGILLMGWARVWAGAHHFSDVTASSLLGGLWGWWMHRRWWAGKARGRERAI
ncbi:MAG: superfamily [Verrucomicrobiota bacterium]|jgi:membrane-associated phospholipid phosphatase